MSINKIIKLLAYKKIKPEIKGTYVDENIKYNGDIDLYTYIKINQSYLEYKDQLYDNFLTIINNIKKSNNLYFIEFKAGFDILSHDITNQKVRWDINEIKQGYKILDNGKRYDFYKILEHPYSVVKIDVAYWDDDKKLFTEVSNIYDFFFKGETKKTKSQVIEDIEDEMLTLYEEGKKWKALRRKYSLAKIENDQPVIKELVNFFNSDIGLLAFVKSHLETVILVSDLYKNKSLKHKVALSIETLNTLLNKINIDPIHYKTLNQLKKSYKQIDKLLNKKSKSLASKLINM